MRSAYGETKTNRILARAARGLACRIVKMRADGELAANRQQYVQNKFSIYQFGCAENQLKTVSFLLTNTPTWRSACRQWMALPTQHHIADGVEKSVEFICVHITAVYSQTTTTTTTTTIVTRRQRHENQLNNKSFSLVRDGITRRQQIKWQRYIYAITTRWESRVCAHHCEAFLSVDLK